MGLTQGFRLSSSIDLASRCKLFLRAAPSLMVRVSRTLTSIGWSRPLTAIGWLWPRLEVWATPRCWSPNRCYTRVLECQPRLRTGVGVPTAATHGCWSPNRSYTWVLECQPRLHLRVGVPTAATPGCRSPNRSYYTRVLESQLRPTLTSIGWSGPLTSIGWLWPRLEVWVRWRGKPWAEIGRHWEGRLRLDHVVTKPDVTYKHASEVHYHSRTLCQPVPCGPSKQTPGRHPKGQANPAGNLFQESLEGNRSCARAAHRCLVFPIVWIPRWCCI